MNHIFTLILFCLYTLKVLGGTIEKVGSNFLQAYASNKGEITYYQFNMNLQTQIKSNAFVEVIFPQDYNLFNFASIMECATRYQTQAEFVYIPCSFQFGNIIRVNVNSVQIGQLSLVVGKVINPTTVTTTSNFRVQTLYQDVVIDRNEVFGSISLGPSPVTLTGTSIEVVSNIRISEGSSWRFRFKTVNTYTGANTLRFSFPDGFISSNAMCEVQNYFGDNPATEIKHNRRILSCISVQKTLTANVEQVVTLVNMVNPAFSGLFVGFGIEIMDGNSAIVKEKSVFDGNIQILPGLLNIDYDSEHKFKMATVIYGFFINLVNRVESTGRLYMNFSSEFKLNDQNCSLINGFNKRSDGTSVTCRLIEGANSYVVEDFAYIDSSARLTIAALIKTPDVEGTYPVTIATYNTIKNSYIDSNSKNIIINATYGTNEIFRAHSMNPPVRLKAGETGSLEIIFFLKNLLPFTNVDSIGRFRIEIYPPIKPPPNDNGQLYCTFFATVPAQSCTFELIPNTNPYKTLIYVTTPEEYTFKESEIPLTITTKAPSVGFKAGLDLDPLIKRYNFHIHMFNCDCDLPDDQPTEVFFTEFVPEYFEIPDKDITAIAIIQNKNEYSYLIIDYVHKDLETFIDEHTGYDRNYVFRVVFDKESLAWAEGLGWPLNDIIIDFPCAVDGGMVGTSKKIKCDLNTYVDEAPFAPFIEIYGFETQNWKDIPKDTTGISLKIEIPKIKLKDDSGDSASITFQLFEVTPAMNSLYVELYRAKVDNIFTTKDGTITTNSYYTNHLVTFTNNVVNKPTAQSYDLSNVVTSDGLEYMIVQYENNLFQDVATEQDIDCTPSVCTIYREPVNWIIVKGTSTSFTIPTGKIRNPPHEYQLTYTVRKISANMLTQIGTFTGLIVPEEIQNKGFVLSNEENPSKLYGLTEHKFQFNFVNMNPTPDNWAIKLTFDELEVQKTQFFYEDITDESTLPVYDYRGALYTKIDNTLKISNFKGINTGVTITSQLMLITQKQSPSTPKILIETYYNENLNYRIDVTSVFVNCSTAPLTLNPHSFSRFEVKQPVEWDIAPGAGYIGPFNFLFQPTSQLMAPKKLRITFQEDFATPSGPNDPMFCELSMAGGSFRSPCTQGSSQNPLVVTATFPPGIFATELGMNSFVISTEFVSPTNGIKFPSQGNYFFIKLDVLGGSDEILEEYSDFIFINPPSFGSFNIFSEMKTKGHLNIFTIEFQTKREIPAFSDGGRIQFEFPTLDEFGVLFEPDLGYTGAVSSDPIGCWFDPDLTLVKASADVELQCILVKSKLVELGSPSKVEVINFAIVAADSNIRIRIGHIKNPDPPVGQVRMDCEISASIFKRNIVSGDYDYIHFQGFRVFLDLQEKPIGDPNFDHPYGGAVALEFDPSTAKVDDIGVSLKTQIYSPNGAFDIGDVWITEVPPQFIMSTGNIQNCDYTVFEYCNYYHDIRWAVYKLKTQVALGDYQLAPIYITKLPISVPLINTIFYAYIWQSKLYKSKSKQIITAEHWATLNQNFISPSLEVVGLESNLVQNKKKVEVIVTFTTNSRLVSSGSLEIKFGNDIPQVYPHCRSSVAQNSKLNAKAQTGLDKLIGEIGCAVQNTKSWVLTGYADLEPNQLIKIYGLIDMPTNGAISSGVVEIITYSDRHETDINQFGNIIAKAQTNTIAISGFGNMEIENQFTLINTQNLKVGYIGPFKARVNFASNVVSDVTILLFRNDNHATTATNTGFQDQIAEAQNVVCWYTDTTTEEDLSCIAAYSLKGTGVNTYIEIQTIPYSPLISGTEYIINIDIQHTRTASTNKGLLWPTQIGRYRIELTAQTNTIFESLYFDVFGPNFSSDTYIRGCVNIENEWNLIEVNVKPTNTIGQFEQLIIEFPTKSSDGINLFSDDLGMGLQDSDTVVLDILEGVNMNKIVCLLYRGLQSLGKPVQIVCSSFNKHFTSSDSIRFFFAITNPDVPTDTNLYLPVIMYSVLPSSQGKNNYQLFDKSIFVRDGALQEGINQITPSDTSVYTFPIDGQGLNEVMREGTMTYKTFTGTPLTGSTLLSQISDYQGFQDYYILKFAFDLQKSGKFVDQLSNSGVSAKGDVYMLQNLRTIVTAPTNFFNPTLNSGRDGIGVWTNPKYYLAEDYQRVLIAYTSQHRTQISEKVIYQEQLPTFSRIKDGSITFALIPRDGNVEQSQYEDYEFKVTSNRFDKINVVVITVPSQITFSNNFENCQMSKSSQIEVERCYIKKAQSLSDASEVWVHIVKKESYGTGSMVLAIVTTNFAIQNFVSIAADNVITNYNLFGVRLLGWIDSYKPLSITNTDVLSYKFDQQALSGQIQFSTVYATVPPPVIYDVVYERYIDDVPHFDNTNQVAAIRFDMLAPAECSSLTGTNYHKLLVKLPAYMITQNTPVYEYDLLRYSYSCQLNDIEQVCTYDSTAHVMSVQFQISLTQFAKFSVKISQIDQYDYPTKDGFKWTNANGIGQYYIEFWQYISGTHQKFITTSDHDGFHLNTGTLGNAIRYFRLTSFANKWRAMLNIIQMEFQFDRIGINWFVIEIYTMDEKGGQIYQLTKMHDISSGEQFPCSFSGNLQVADTEQTLCIFEEGINEAFRFGKPMRIYVTNFNYQIDLPLKLNLLIKNPDFIGQVFKIGIKAFGGGNSLLIFNGELYYGYVNFQQKNILKICFLFNFTYGYIESAFITENDFNVYVQSSSPAFTPINGKLGSIFQLKVDSGPYFLLEDKFSIIKIPIIDATIGEICSVTGIDRSIVMYQKQGDDLVAWVIQQHKPIGGLPFIAQNSFYYISGLKCKLYGKIGVLSSNSVWKVINLNSFAMPFEKYFEYVSPWTSSRFNSPAAQDYTGTQYMQLVEYQLSANKSDIDIFAIMTFDQNRMLQIGYELNQQVIMAYRFEQQYTGYMDANGVQKCFVIDGIANTQNYFEPVGCEVETIGSGLQQLVITNFDTIERDGKDLRILVKYHTQPSPLIAPDSGRYDIQWFLWSNKQGKDAENSVLYHGQPMANSFSIFLNHYEYSNQLTGATARMENIQLNGLILSYDLYYNPLSGTAVSGGQFTSLDIKFRNINTLSQDTCSGQLFYTSSSSQSANYSPFPMDWQQTKTSKGCTIYKFNLQSAVSGSQQYWVSEEYGFKITHTLTNLDDFQDFKFWVSVSVSIEGTEKSYHEFESNVNFPISQAPIDIITESNAPGSVTEIKFQISGIKRPMTQRRALFLDFAQGTWPDYIVRGTNLTNYHVRINCKCQVGFLASSLQDSICHRHLFVAGKFKTSISIHKDVTEGSTLTCYIPDIYLPSTVGTWTIDFKLLDPSHPISFDGSYLDSLYRQRSNVMANAGSITHSDFTLTTSMTYQEEIGSPISGYSLTLSGLGGISNPYILINFGEAGPVPNSDLVSGIASDFRVYTIETYVLYFYITGSHSSITLTGTVNTVSKIPSTSSMIITIDIYSGRNWRFHKEHSVNNQLTPDNSAVPQALIHPYANNIKGFPSLYIISSTIGSLKIPVNGAIIIDIPATVGITQISPQCHASIKGSLSLLYCIIEESAGAYNIVVRPLLEPIPLGSRLFVNLGITNPPNDIEFQFSTYSFYKQHEKSYKVVSSYSSTVINKDYASHTYQSINMVKMYPFAPILFLDGTIVKYAPIRINFKIPSNTVPNSNTKIRITIPNTFGYYDTDTNNVRICQLKEYDEFISNSYINSFPNCIYLISGNNIVVEFDNPRYRNYLSSISYQAILSTYSTYVKGFSNPVGHYKIEWLMKTSSTNNNYFQRINYQFKGAQQIKLTKFQLTSDKSSQDTSQQSSMQFDFTMTSALDDANSYPGSYMELIFPSLSLSRIIINQNQPIEAGQEVPCGMSTSFKKVDALQLSPRCVAFNQKSTNYLVVKVQGFKGYDANTQFWLAFDDLYIERTLSYKTPFNVDFNLYVDGATYRERYYRRFQHMFQIDHVSSVSVLSMKGTVNANNPSNLQVSAGPQAYGFTVVSTFQPSVKTSDDKGSKFSIQFPVNNGPWAVNNNIRTATVSDTLSAGSYTVLWYNEKTGRIFYDSKDILNAESNTVLVGNLYNPHSWLVNTYGTPLLIKIDQYQNYHHKYFYIGQMKTKTIFTPLNSPVTISSITTDMPFVTNQQYTRLKIKLQFQFGTQNNAYMDDNFLYYLQLNFQSGIQTVNDCYFVSDTGQYYTTCNIISNTQILFSGLFNSNVELGSPSGSWEIFFHAKLSASLVETLIQLQNRDKVVNQQVTIQKTIANFVSATTIPNLLQFINNKFVPNYYELQSKQVYLSGSEILNKLQIKFQSKSILNYGESITIQNYKLNNNYKFIPSTFQEDKNFQRCLFIPVTGAQTYGLPLSSELCTYLTTTEPHSWNIQAPRGGLPGGKYILTIEARSTSPGFRQPLQLPTSVDDRYEFTLNFVGSSTQLDNLKLQLQYQFQSLYLKHTSLTVREYDFLEIGISPSQNILFTNPIAPIKEIVYYIDLQASNYPTNGELKTSYEQEPQGSFINGNSHVFMMATADANTKLITQFGEQSLKTPLRFALVQHGPIMANQIVILKIPLITNPTTPQSLTAIITIVQYVANFPSVLMRYELKNHAQVQATTVSQMDVTMVSNAGNIVQSQNLKFTTRITNFGGSIATTDYILLKWDTSLKGVEFKNLKNFAVDGWSITFYDTFYIFQMTPLSAISTTSLDLALKNAFEANNFVSSYGIKWAKKISNILTTHENSIIAPLTLAKIEDAVSKGLTRVQGYTNAGSQVWITMQFMAPALVEGGFIEIILPNSLKTGPPHIGVQCRPGKAFQRGINLPLECYKVNDQTYIIEGYRNQTANLVVSVHMFVTQVNTGSQIIPTVNIYGTKNINDVILNTGNIGSFIVDGDPSLKNYLTDLRYVAYVYAHEWGPFQEIFTLRENTLKATGFDYLIINFPEINLLDQTNKFYMQSGGNIIQIVKYRFGSAKAFVDSKFIYSQPQIIAPPDTGLDMMDSAIYSVIITTEQHETDNGVKRPSPGLYRFWIEAWDGFDTKDYDNDGVDDIEDPDLNDNQMVEISYYDFLLEPRPDSTLKVEPLLLGTSLKSIYKVSYTLQTEVQAGDRLKMIFTTYDFLDEIFKEDLGLGFTIGVTSGEIDCPEESGFNFISDARPRCYVYKGYKGYVGVKGTQQPTNIQPARIEMDIEKTIPVDTQIIFYLGFIENPSVFQKICTIGLSINRYCRLDGYKCPIMSSNTFFITTATQQVTYSINAGNTITATGVVLNTAQTHTFNIYFQEDITINDWILIQYGKDNHRLHYKCASGAKCISFVTNQMILYQPDAIKANGGLRQFIVTGVTNGWFSQGENFFFQFWKGSDKTFIFGQQSVAPIYALEDSFSNMYFNTTQTSTYTLHKPQYNYYLKGFQNVYDIQIGGLWINADIKQFWIVKPAAIEYFNTTYCNATLGIDVVKRLPYPLRYKCKIYEDKVSIDLTDDTEAIKGWEDPYNSYKISVQVKGFLPENYTGANIDPFKAYGLVVPFGNFDIRKAVTYGEGAHPVTPYDVPDLADLTLNTLSFQVRRARIGNVVEYYLILKPITQVDFKQIDKIIFRAPEEFAYPSKQYLDSCNMRGNIDTDIEECKLDRKDRKTYITVIPDKFYRHEIKIIRLTDADIHNLFPAPMLPGNHYNMSVELYVGDYLTEKSTINISAVLGWDLDDKLMTVKSLLDEDTLGLYEFKFRLGNTSIPVGYNSEITQIWSTIHLSFDNKDGFENDLGTGLTNGSEIGCAIRSGITHKVKKRLDCRLYHGTNTEHLPYIVVSGYDAVSEDTDVEILVTKLRTLGVDIRKSVSIGVQLTYNYVGGAKAFFYIPTAKEFDVTSLQTIQTTSTGTIDISGSTEVLGYTKYEISFVIGNLPVGTDDYFFIEFPDNFFEKYSDFSLVTCHIVPPDTGVEVACKEILVFGISNMIYIKPNKILPVSTSGEETKVIIRNMINSAFSFSGVQFFRGYLQISGKIKAQYAFSTLREITPCSTFGSLSSISSSNIGGENSVTYTITFITGHSIPKEGAISIYFPDKYDGNLYSMGATCRLIGFLSDNIASCRIGGAKRVDIIMNGEEISDNLKYQIQIIGINNPNLDSNSLFFTITSFYESNIYSDRKICSSDFSFPLITVNSVSSCLLFSSTQFYNVGVQSLYTFQFTCKTIIRDNTDVIIYLPSEYQETNFNGQDMECISHESTTMASKQCEIKIDNQGNMYVQGSLRFIEYQKSFSVQFQLVNPNVAKSDYTFSAKFSKSGIMFANAPIGYGIQQLISIIDNTDVIIEDPNTLQVSLTNIPKNAGEQAYYVFSIAPRKGLGIVEEMKIFFPANYKTFTPKTFSYEIGTNMECGLYALKRNDRSFMTYQGLVKLTKGKTTAPSYFKLPCSIKSERVLTIESIYQKVTQSMGDNWYHWIITNVNNPSSYSPGEVFKLVYYSQKIIQWQVTKSFQYFISDAPDYIKMGNIGVSNNNIKNKAVYNFTVLSSGGFLERTPNLGISILLPTLYNDVLDKFDKFSCKVLVSTFNLSNTCDIYQSEILLEGINLQALQTSTLNISIDSLINPTTSTQCKSIESSSSNNNFQIKLIDLSINEVVYSTSPSVDDKNCIEFQKTQFFTKVIGSTVLQAGLTYTYIMELEKQGTLLQIVPSSTQSGLKFVPDILQFDGYWQTQQSFSLKVRGDMIPGTYQINFEKIEQEDSVIQFYEPLLPLTVIVVNSESPSYKIPTIKVQDVKQETIGFPIKVPVLLSQAPSNIILLSIEAVHANENNILLISPSTLELTPSTLETFFEITIKSNTIPKTIKLMFSTSSLYASVHMLIPQVKYLVFKPSNSKRVTPPSLSVRLQDNNEKINAQFLNMQVFNLIQESKFTESLYAPEILLTSKDSISANGAHIQAYISSFCDVYYCIALQGSLSPTAQQLYSNKFEKCLQFGKITTQTKYSKTVDYIVDIQFNYLQGQTNYAVFMSAIDGMGFSQVKSITFKTLILSYGVIIKLPISALVSEEQVLRSLSKTLRISSDRFQLQTKFSDLEKELSEYQSDIMIKPNLYYEIIIKPNTTNDNLTPEHYANLLKLQEYKTQLTRIMSQYDKSLDITYLAIRQTSPTISLEAFQLSIFYYNVTYKIRLDEKGNVFAILKDKIQETIVPNSIQIQKGFTEQNQELGQYRKSSTLSDDNGDAIIFFDDLSDNTEYVLYITVGNYLPYEPIMLSNDNDVRRLVFITPENINIRKSIIEKFEILRRVNPELEQSLRTYLEVPYIFNINFGDDED